MGSPITRRGPNNSTRRKALTPMQVVDPGVGWRDSRSCTPPPAAGPLLANVFRRTPMQRKAVPGGLKAGLRTSTERPAGMGWTAARASWARSIDAARAMWRRKARQRAAPGVCREWSRLDGRRRARLLGTYDLLPMPLTVRARRPRPRRGAHAVKGPRRSETPSAVPKAALSKLRGGAETSVGHGSFLRKPSAKYRPSVGR